MDPGGRRCCGAGAGHLEALRGLALQFEFVEGTVRTTIIILIGFVVWSVCLGIGKVFSRSGPSAMTVATVAFVVIWFAVAGVNMWLGISRAGYSFQEELPVFLIIFLLPAAVAIFVKVKFL
jgi:hypothetical protein